MAKWHGLYKRGKIWWIRYADLSGVIRRESSGSTSYEVAANLLTDKRKELKDGKDPKKVGNFTFEDLCVAYERGLNHQKYLDTKRSFIKFFRAEFDSMQLKHFNTRIVEDWRSKMLSRCRTVATANRYLACLHHMFTKAEEYEMVTLEVLQKVRRVKLLPENNERVRFLSKDECKRLISVCTDDIKPIVIIALNTGMRKNEILTLQWNKNIDLVHNLISINKTKNNQRRDIPINTTVKQTLQGMVRPIDQLYVFVRKGGQPYKTINKKFWQARDKAGLKDFRFHDLRHTFASQLIMAGADIMTIKELLGHKSLRMTLRYTHLAPSMKTNAVEALDRSMKTNDVYTQVYNDD